MNTSNDRLLILSLFEYSNNSHSKWFLDSQPVVMKELIVYGSIMAAACCLYHLLYKRTMHSSDMTMTNLVNSGDAAAFLTGCIRIDTRPNPVLAQVL